MKTIKYFWTLCLAVAAFTLTACSDDDTSGSSSQMRIDQIYLENINDDVNPDRPVEFARLGQLLRIQGSGFTGLKKIYINGYETYFNNALMTDNNVWVTLNSKTPIEKADEDVRNTIILYKSDNNQLIYSFTIRAAAPSISNVDNTLPKAGELVIVTGTNLHGTTKVILPDGTEITNGIESDEDGEWFSFTVPANANLNVAGSITSEGIHGIAKSPEYFNDFRNYIIDFDGKGVMGAWSATYSSEDLVDDPLNTGRGKVAMLVPNVKLDAGGLDVGSNTLLWATAGNDDASDDWTSRMYAAIPAATPASEVALQFDIYCPDPWDGSGQLEISLQNNLSNYGYGSGCTKYSSEYYNTAMVWVPWLNEVDGSHAAWSTGERWQTITIPMTKFGNYNSETVKPNRKLEGDEKIADIAKVEKTRAEIAKATFQNICEDRNAGSYRNLVFLFVNSDLEYTIEADKEEDDIIITYPASLFTQKIYIDNLRVVKTTPITVSDFDDDTEETTEE